MRLAEISWPKAKAYFEANDAVLFAIGSIESHGTHNVLGVDTLIPDRLLELIEPQSDVLIAPTIPYGACDTLSRFPGTITLGNDLLYSLLKQITDELYRNGARRFYFLNGHGGNIAALDRLSLELSRKGAWGVQFNWWLMAWDLNPAWKGGHGGAEETAAMMAVNPDLVNMDALQEMNLQNDVGDDFATTGFKSVRYKGVEIPVIRDVTSYTENGWIGPDHPKEASREWGVEMLEKTATYIVDFMQAYQAVSLPKGE